MKTIVIAAMLVAAPVFAAEDATTAKADSAIRAVFAQIDTCIAKNDSKCYGEFLADDATISQPLGGAKLIKGKTEIINAVRGMMSDSKKHPKQRLLVQNTRLIGLDHAFFDCSVEFSGEKAPAAADGQLQTWHATGLMVLKGGKWLVQDYRSYVVEAASPPKAAQSPAPTHVTAPAAPAQPNVPAEPAAPAPPAQPNVPADPAAPPKA